MISQKSDTSAQEQGPIQRQVTFEPDIFQTTL